MSVSEKTAGEAYRGSSANDYHSGSERLMMGRGGDDELTADNDGRTMIHGGAGDDVLRADIYKGAVFGGVGDDFLWADAAYARLLGGRGDDLLSNVGTYGNVSMKGGPGADTFRLDAYDTAKLKDFRSGRDAIEIILDISPRKDVDILYDVAKGKLWLVEGGHDPSMNPLMDPIARVEPGTKIKDGDIDLIFV